MHWVARFITQHNKLMIGIFVVLTLVLAWFVQNFRIDASAETLLLKNNKLYIETQVINQRFAPQEFILVAYEPKSGDVFSEASFTTIAQLSEAFSKLDRVASVTNILNVPLLSKATSLDAKLDPDEWKWQTKHYGPQEMREVFKNHPLYTDLLVNQAMTATAIQVVFKADKALSDIQNQITDLQKKVLNDELTEQDQQRIDSLRQQADPLEQQLNQQRQKEINEIYHIIEPYKQQANIYLGGAQVLAFQLIDIIQNDLVIFGSAIGVVICLLLLVIFGQFRWVLIPMICCAVSVVLTIGLFGLLDLRTTVISSNFVAL